MLLSIEMITDTTAAHLAHNLVVYREMLSVALALLAEAQRSIAANERTIADLREELRARMVL
jgi:hypothetical protein